VGVMIPLIVIHNQTSNRGDTASEISIITVPRQRELCFLVSRRSGGSYSMAGELCHGLILTRPDWPSHARR
jgi:hypothetical protein